MWDKTKKIIAVILFSVIFIAILSCFDKLFERKYSYSKYADFYAQEQDFDVLFLGTSHVINAVYPMELWDEYGIVSYNMANHSENICMNYWQLKNALKYTTPKVVVVDLYAVDGDSKVNLKYFHNFTDMLPMSLFKLQMVMDLLPKEEWAEYFFEFSIYHSRWDDLTDNDKNPEISTEKGAELSSEVTPDVVPEVISKDDIYDEKSVNSQYLQKIINLCNEKGIDVILTYLPYSAPKSHQQVANWGYVIAQENNIPYLNFFYEDFELNYVTDCADIGSHLNASGARKITQYLGKFIQDNYDVPDRRSDANYAFWYEDYEEYEIFKRERLNDLESVQEYLLSLNDRNLETSFKLTEDADILNDADMASLVENIGTIGNISYMYEDGDSTIYWLIVTDKNTGETVSRRIIKYNGEGDYAMCEW